MWLAFYGEVYNERKRIHCSFCFTANRHRRGASSWVPFFPGREKGGSASDACTLRSESFISTCLFPRSIHSCFSKKIPSTCSPFIVRTGRRRSMPRSLTSENCFLSRRKVRRARRRTGFSEWSIAAKQNISGLQGFPEGMPFFLQKAAKVTALFRRAFACSVF